MVSATSFVIFALALSMVNCQRLEIFMFARGLPNMDPADGAPDALLYVYSTGANGGAFEQIGETNNLSDNNNPDWSERFEVTYSGGSAQRLKFDVYDADWPDADDYMGYVEFPLSELYNAFGRVLVRPIQDGSGELTVTAKLL